MSTTIALYICFTCLGIGIGIFIAQFRKPRNAIKRQDIISDEALKAPLEYACNLSTLQRALDEYKANAISADEAFKIFQHSPHNSANYEDFSKMEHERAEKIFQKGLNFKSK